MKALKLGGAAALALVLAACGGGGGNLSQADLDKPLTQIKAPQGDWTQVISETPQGGFLMGNPNAPVKLIEYASLSCPYCANFDKEGVPTLRGKYVKSGQVSWEYRTYMNHPTDPALSVLVHCQGAGPFFALADQLYATQQEWYDRVASAPPAQLDQLQSLPVTQRNAAIARLAGLDEFFRQRGMPTAKFDACLADEGNLAKVGAITELGNKDQIGGTPGFLINGKVVPDVASWKALEPQLRAAVK
jgi:protein-disulfide isomerase